MLLYNSLTSIRWFQNNLLNIPLPRGKEPIPSSCIPQHYPSSYPPVQMLWARHATIPPPQMNVLHDELRASAQVEVNPSLGCASWWHVHVHFITFNGLPVCRHSELVMQQFLPHERTCCMMSSERLHRWGLTPGRAVQADDMYMYTL